MSNTFSKLYEDLNAALLADVETFSQECLKIKGRKSVETRKQMMDEVFLPRLVQYSNAVVHALTVAEDIDQQKRLRFFDSHGNWPTTLNAKYPRPESLYAILDGNHGMLSNNPYYSSNELSKFFDSQLYDFF